MGFVMPGLDVLERMRHAINLGKIPRFITERFALIAWFFRIHEVIDGMKCHNAGEKRMPPGGPIRCKFRNRRINDFIHVLLCVHVVIEPPPEI